MTTPYSNWCFTINNPSIENDDDEPGRWQGVKYLVYQLEAGEQGTVHWQGYVCFTSRKRLAQVKAINARAHWENRKGTHEEARAYCMKPGRFDGPYEFGEAPGKVGAPKRSKYEDLVEYLKTKPSMQDVAESMPAMFMRHRANISEYMRLTSIPRTTAPEVLVYWGPSGIGKSRRAIFEAGESVYFKMQSTQTGDWWDGYNCQRCVVINDFYGWIQHCELLRLLDHYPHQVKVHGGMVNFDSPLIIITSNHHPSQWYSPTKFTYAGGPLERRLMEFGRVVHLANPWTEEMSEDFIGPRQNPLVAIPSS